MKKILLIALAIIALESCKSNKGGSGGYSYSGSKGEIVTSGKSKSFTPIKPYGMVPIPSGSFVLGQTDYDFTNAQNAPAKTVTVQGFFMDDAEVTNEEYRDFVYYVRDSVARQILAEKVEEVGVAGEEGIGQYAFVGTATVEENGKGEVSAYDEYISSVTNDRDGGYDSRKRLDWDVPLYWNVEDYPDVTYAEVLEGLYYAPEDRYNGERSLDVSKLNYRFTTIDKGSAARSKQGARSDYVVTEEFNIYPDTTVWIRDFEYAFNEPMHEHYFWHEAYNTYPVVGVTWDQANAFCNYKTIKQNTYLSSKKGKSQQKVFAYRLPTEIEWEYAARGGLDDAPYPWGGPYLTDDRGCYLANFKPKRGDYIEGCTKQGGFMYTGPVKTFASNGYGLYDMAGNVSEWTASPYENASYSITADLNPTLNNKSGNPRKVVRGGSWKDIGYLLQVSYRNFEHMDSARSFIGFRTAQTIPEGATVRYPTSAQ